MKKANLSKRIMSISLLVTLLICSFTSCGTKHEGDGVTLSFKGNTYSYAESEDAIYWGSYENNSGNLTNYICSYTKNGKRNWEIKSPYHGEVFPLKDGRFFYADADGHICGYSAKGKLLWETQVDLAESINSNFFLGQNDALIVNLMSSPSDSTAFCSINIDGEKTVSPPIQNLATCFTHNYPLGGYITEGYNGEHMWVINRLNDDFSIRWTYCAGAGMYNLYIRDITQDGKILFEANRPGESDFLKELDAEGQLTNEIRFSSRITAAAYFQDKIVVCTDLLYVLNTDFIINNVIDDLLNYPRIKAFDDTFFVYTPGSYSPGAAVVYDGYCRQYDENLTLLYDKVFEEADRFIEIGDNGKRYYRK